MPKFFSRVDFETMKVLRKRGSSIHDIAKAVGRSVGAVSRNLKYKNYEDYLAAMYSHKSKFQKEVEAKSGPVVVTKPSSKKCSCCGELKDITEFTPDKNTKDGHKGQCRKCINAKIRARRKARREAVKNIAEQSSKNTEPSVETKLDWLFKLANEHDRRLKQIETELDERFHSDESAEEEQPSGQGLEPRVGEVLNVFVDRKIRRAEIMGSREITEFGYHEKRYLVRYKKFFRYKYADVSEAVLYAD